MTPTIFSAVFHAGYHVGLATGNAAAVRAEVAEIQAQVLAGVGVTLYALYINQRQFGFQYPLRCAARACPSRASASPHSQHGEGCGGHRRAE